MRTRPCKRDLCTRVISDQDHGQELAFHLFRWPTSCVFLKRRAARTRGDAAEKMVKCSQDEDSTFTHLAFVGHNLTRRSMTAFLGELLHRADVLDSRLLAGVKN